MAHDELSPVKQALQAIQDLQAKLAAAESARNEPIAIVGMACRYPGAANLAAFWRLLLRGDDAVTEVPSHRWDLNAVYDPDPTRPGKMTSRWAGLIDRLDEFDAAFFGISPREAPHVDPRQRLALEIAWEALEDAGIPPDTLAGTHAGVFMATLTNDYDHLLFEDLRRAESYSGAGTANSIIANRLSYFLDLHGPSVALDTACSGSLVAVHLACESLRSGESTLALAGGVNVNLMPKSNVFFSKAGALSPTGRCRTFDRAADGMVRSDGAGIIVLKRLSQAIADGDGIVAVIKGSAVNHDGRSNGLMAPNGEAQRAVLTEAYRRAGVSPADVQYIEAHGTGTRLGDPIEVSSLAAVLTPNRPSDRRCLLGSVKTNIGHSEAAAAIAGVIKTALALRHRVVPPTVHFTEPNPLIPFDRLPFAVPQEVSPWPSPNRPLIAGISGFGFGGTNAHVVLEAAPAEVGASIATAANVTGANGTHDTNGTNRALGATESAPDAQLPSESTSSAASATAPLVLPLSARTPRALTALVHAYRQRLAGDAGNSQPDAATHSPLTKSTPTPSMRADSKRTDPRRTDAMQAGSIWAESMQADLPRAETDAADVCAAAAVGRTHHAYRAAFVGDSADALRGVIDRWIGGAVADADAAAVSRLVFVFSGQGSHWPRMGMDLYRREPVFAAVLDECDRLFARHSSSESILEELARDASASRLDETEITQPAIFAVQMALQALWRSFGIVPAVVIGHSLGEVAAACAAGALSLEDGVRVVHHRSRLMARAAGRGRTAVVGLSLADAREAIRGYEPALAVAGSNSPDASVIAGDPVSVERLQRMLDARGVFCRLIPGVSVAFHSPQMEPLRHELVRALADLAPKAASIPIMSTVTATLVDGESLDADYWGRNLREPFLFAQAIETALAQRCDAFLEVSPHTVLSSSIAKCARHAGAAAVPVLCSLRRDEPEAATLLGQLARLYELGQPVRWQNVHRHHPRPRTATPLPTYPWQRQRYWFDQLSTGTGTDSAEAATTTAAAATTATATATATASTRRDAAAHPLLGAADVIEPATLAASDSSAEAARVCLWEMTFDETHPSYVSDHRVLDSVVLPGAAIIEIADAVARQLWSDRARAATATVTVSDLRFEQALHLSAGPRRVQATLTIRPDADATTPAAPAAAGATARATSADATSPGALATAGAATRTAARVAGADAAAAPVAAEGTDVAVAEFTLHSRPIRDGRAEGAWTRHATGRVAIADANVDAAASETASIDIALLKARCPEALAPDAHYEAMEATGLRYGPSFRAIRALHVGPREALAEIALAPALADARYGMHPALLDAAITTIAAVVRRDDPENYLPLGVRQWQVHRPARSERVWCHARYTGRDGQLLLADLDLFDDRGALVASLEGLALAPFGAPRRLPLADSLIEERWEPSPVPAGHDDDSAPTGSLGTPATWLLLADNTGLADAVADHLRTTGARVIVAHQGPEYRRLAADRIELRADRPDDLTRLITDATSLTAVAHFWSLDTPAVDENAPIVDAMLGCVSALHLAQALVSAPSTASEPSAASAQSHLVAAASARPPRLWFVTRGAQAIGVGGAESGRVAVAVAQAPVHGLALAIGQEHPELRCSTLDVDRAVASTPTAEAGIGAEALLVSEELLRGSDEARIAWRGGTRYVARLGRWALSQETGAAQGSRPSHEEAAVRPARETAATAAILPAKQRQAAIRSDATYLITGGLGALGLQTAAHFARQGARHLVLTGRRGVEGCSAAALEAIREIQQLGVSITIASADVASAAHVERLFGDLLPRLPALAGVVHAAGVLDDALLAGQSIDRLQRVMAPKVLGAWHLHLRTRALPLDFFVCYSSAASLIGSAGQANYAAANAFLDALAHHRRACGLPALSVNWSAWGGDGMAATDQMRQRLEARGMSVMRAADALAMLSRLLQDPACPPAIGVIPVDWNRFVQQFPAGVPARFAGLVSARTQTSAHAAAGDSLVQRNQIDPLNPLGPFDGLDLPALVALPAPERSARLRDVIRRELAVVLGFEASPTDISSRAKYFDLGMDSLTAVEFRNRLQHTFAITLPATLAFDYPTIDTLAESIDAMLAATLAASVAARAATETAATAVVVEPLGASVPKSAAESESVPGVEPALDIDADLLDTLPTHEIALLLASELDEEGPRVR